MSLLQFLTGPMLEDMSDLYDQHFGSGLSLDDLIKLPSRAALMAVPLKSGYLRPWRFLNPKDSGTSNITSSKEGFKVTLDVRQFKPEELKVKVMKEYVVIDGKHEEKKDEYGFVSRQFTRRYKLPNDVDDKTLRSSVSSDGILILEADKKAVLPACFYQEVPIIQTNRPASVGQSKAVVKRDDMQVLPAQYFQNIPIVQTNESPKKEPAQQAGQGDATSTKPVEIEAENMETK